ncbi:WYL domain-containing protein [Anaerotignum sp.]|uniref:WYL domain-containing protein n=1 Tax=Anaerotignum sp. TaxID=2039241 RepID=UPI0029D71D1A|nr:WYL domain-containing protein [Anaerotignum sp.]MCI6058083.1 WYL domain-containing protein [Clostridia bacterium]MDY3595600.1 WYL domain-containing protein [Anaerotignum sp.]
MAYSELVKNFNRIRDYMREFYVYGFKSREEYRRKSARSYDDERRRIESWLGDYMGFRQNADGKNVFISIDSRAASHNPLYKAWKTKSFTDGDITLHFILMDIFASAQKALSLTEITEQIDEYLSVFPEPKTFDVSTVRKKLNEYISEGIVLGEKQGKSMYYSWTMEKCDLDRDILDFFSEIAPCGVIGSFLLDQVKEQDSHFSFKHHYITSAMDSEILCSVFMAIREKRSVILETYNRHKEHVSESHVVPLRVMVSAQSGRQYLMAYAPRFRRILSFRTDHIASVKIGEVSERFDQMRQKLDEMQKHMWGVSTQNRWGNRMEHVEFTIRYGAGEKHIPKRLEREKRCGTVEHLDENTSKFTADVYEASELIPWIRTFICRITEIHISNEKLEEQFLEDIKAMYALYGLEDGENHDIQ